MGGEDAATRKRRKNFVFVGPFTLRGATGKAVIALKRTWLTRGPPFSVRGIINSRQHAVTKVRALALFPGPLTASARPNLSSLFHLSSPFLTSLSLHYPGEKSTTPSGDINFRNNLNIVRYLGAFSCRGSSFPFSREADRDSPRREFVRVLKNSDERIYSVYSRS